METRRAKKQKTAEQGPPTTITSLPLELLTTIFDMIKDDKHTLARCMRVSPQFNFLAAPILYHTVKLDGRVGFFDHIAPLKPIKRRITPPKIRNLAHIEIVDYETHARSICRLKQRTQTVHVDVVRVVSNADKHDLATSLCYCFEIIASRKVIERQIEFDLDFRRHDVLTLIVKPEGSPWGHRTSRIMTEKQLVLIFGSNPTDLVLPMPNREANWSHTQDQLLTFCLESNCPRDIIFVNIEHTVAGLNKHHETENMSQCEQATSYFKTQFDKKVKVETKFSPHLAEIRSTKFTFVTMKDYLANYDCRGEFTDEEIRLWSDYYVKCEEMKKEEEEEKAERGKTGLR